jgi:hypothetical protein
MNGMVDSPGALGDDSCTVTAIRAIDEPGEGLVEVEITVGCSRAAGLWKDRPGEHPWFREFIHQVRLVWNQGQLGSAPEGWIRVEVPRGQLEDFIRDVRQAKRDTDAEYQALLAQRREWIQRDAQAHREKQDDPARRARLAQDQDRIDEVLAQTECQHDSSINHLFVMILPSTTTAARNPAGSTTRNIPFGVIDTSGPTPRLDACGELHTLCDHPTGRYGPFCPCR